MKYVLTSVRSSTPVLYWVSIFLLVLAGLSIVGILFDDRTVQGINVWIKPLKFLISTSIYMMTLGFLLTLYPYGNTKKKIISGLVTWSLFIEMVIIPLQAARGVQSHYNMESAFDGILFGSMGLLIGLNVLIMVLFIVDTLRLKMRVSAPVQLAILFGWLVVLFGSWVGGRMISQMSHTVGFADGGAGLPFLNWSTKGGDLRIAHFFGLHGIQVIPVFAYLMVKKMNKSKATQYASIILFSLMYAGWIAFTFYQASKGIPIVAVS